MQFTPPGNVPQGAWEDDAVRSGLSGQGVGAGAGKGKIGCIVFSEKGGPAIEWILKALEMRSNALGFGSMESPLSLKIVM
jgi:hypothetical protein